jgi:glycosyltransferase involved in cell wall biosynthesis
MPFRNAAATLPECIASIEAQTLRAFEVIAIDDGSEDASAQLVKSAGFRLLQPGRVGLVAALNIGLAAARSDVIARMDADDVMHPERLAAQLEWIERGFDLVASQVELFPDDEVKDGYREYIRWQNAVLTPEQIDANLYVESPFAHPSVMMRKGFVYAEGPFPEDYELWLRMHARGKKMIKVPRVLLRWRESALRASRTDPRYAREAFDLLRARFLANDPRIRYASELVIWGAGPVARRRVRMLGREGIRPSAWIDVDPLKIGRMFSGVPVHAKEWLEDRDPKPLVLIYVTNHFARDRVIDYLEQRGYRPGIHYLGVG